MRSKGGIIVEFEFDGTEGDMEDAISECEQAIEDSIPSAHSVVADIVMYEELE